MNTDIKTDPLPHTHSLTHSINQSLPHLLWLAGQRAVGSTWAGAVGEVLHPAKLPALLTPVQKGEEKQCTVEKNREKMKLERRK